MSLEPSLPFEFLVEGIAFSQQASAHSREIWRETVALAARAALPEGSWLLPQALSATVFLFPAASIRGDLDNRVKPILDAMIGHVYRDDAQIERIVAQKFEPGRIFKYRTTALLSRALASPMPVVYIRISDDLNEDLS